MSTDEQKMDRPQETTIFISWSGKKSRAFAEIFKPWLEQMLPKTDVWLSSEDIAKGSIWFSNIIDKLKECSCGVVCITRENYVAPWIHFEAGGLIAGLGKARVATILLDILFGELQQPLNQFNGTGPDREGLFNLVKSFNNLSDHPIKPHVLDRTFDKFWGEFETAIRRLFPATKDPVPNPEPSPPAPPPPPFGQSPIDIGTVKAPKRKRSKKASSGAAEQSRLFSNGGK